MRRFLHSIRWRVQAWHALILLLAVAALWLTAYRLAWGNQMRRIDREVVDTERRLVNGMFQATQVETGNKPGASKDDEPRPLRPSEFMARLRTVTLPEETLALFKGTDAGYAWFSLRDREGKILQQSPNAPADLRMLPVPETDVREELRTTGQRREFARSFSHGLCSVVGRDMTPELAEQQRYGWSLSAFCGGIWIAGLAGGWWLAGRAIQPIEVISRTASRIAGGNLQERIDVRDTDNELDQLGRVLNQTFERLHAAFERQRRFTADASHELRTPVTILLAETQRILKKERSPAEYREALETCRETAGRMRRLIETLLLLARQDGEAPQSRAVPESKEALGEVTDLSAVLEKTVRQLSVLADRKNLVISTALQPVCCRVPGDALSMLATNLLMNAIGHHHRDTGGVIEINSMLIGSEAVFQVKDNGPGITAADLPHIFERFYRADSARSGGGAHAGLGLAVAAMVTERYGGKIEAKSTGGNGALFEIRFPAAAEIPEETEEKILSGCRETGLQACGG